METLTPKVPDTVCPDVTTAAAPEAMTAAAGDPPEFGQGHGRESPLCGLRGSSHGDAEECGQCPGDEPGAAR